MEQSMPYQPTPAPAAPAAPAAPSYEAGGSIPAAPIVTPSAPPPSKPGFFHDVNWGDVLMFSLVGLAMFCTIYSSRQVQMYYKNLMGQDRTKDLKQVIKTATT